VKEEAARRVKEELARNKTAPGYTPLPPLDVGNLTLLFQVHQ
jgi:hypothetical protein